MLLGPFPLSNSLLLIVGLVNAKESLMARQLVAVSACDNGLIKDACHPQILENARSSIEVLAS